MKTIKTTMKTIKTTKKIKIIMTINNKMKGKIRKGKTEKNKEKKKMMKILKKMIFQNMQMNKINNYMKLLKKKKD